MLSVGPPYTADAVTFVLVRPTLAARRPKRPILGGLAPVVWRHFYDFWRRYRLMPGLRWQPSI